MRQHVFFAERTTIAVYYSDGAMNVVVTDAAPQGSTTVAVRRLEVLDDGALYSEHRGSRVVDWENRRLA
jgi:hypothetical protein